MDPKLIGNLDRDNIDTIVRGIVMVGTYNVVKAPATIINGVVIKPARAAGKAMQGTKLVRNMSQAAVKLGSQIPKATKIAKVGGAALKGINTGGKIASKVLGPLSAFVDIGLLGLDIHLAAKKRDAYADAVKDARNINYDMNQDIKDGRKGPEKKTKQLIEIYLRRQKISSFTSRISFNRSKLFQIALKHDILHRTTFRANVRIHLHDPSTQ